MAYFKSTIVRFINLNFGETFRFIGGRTWYVLDDYKFLKGDLIRIFYTSQSNGKQYSSTVSKNSDVFLIH